MMFPLYERGSLIRARRARGQDASPGFPGCGRTPGLRAASPKGPRRRQTQNSWNRNAFMVCFMSCIGPNSRLWGEAGASLTLEVTLLPLQTGDPVKALDAFCLGKPVEGRIGWADLQVSCSAGVWAEGVRLLLGFPRLWFCGQRRESSGEKMKGRTWCKSRNLAYSELPYLPGPPSPPRG